MSRKKYLMQDYSQVRGSKAGGISLGGRMSGSIERREPLSPKQRIGRLTIIGSIAFLWMFALVARLVSLQIANHDLWEQWAVKQHLTEVKLASERGPIYDRNGRLLAVSVPASSLYVRPQQVLDIGLTVSTLVSEMGLNEKLIREKLSEKRPFVWIKRQVPRSIAEKIMLKKLPGVGTVLEAKRYYPYNEAGGALIGRVGVDGMGLSGLEMAFENKLQGEHISTTLVRDALGKLIQPAEAETEEFDLPKGESVSLTIDAELQAIMDEELAIGRRTANAQAAMGVMIDADSGEILAMGQSPSLNPNADEILSKLALRNLVVETVVEPGSIMKPIVSAAAIDAKVIRPTDLLDCENGSYFFGGHNIKDVHPQGVISLRDVVVRSSNIGMTKVGQRLGKERLYESLRRFGFGQMIPISLPGKTSGILRNVDHWATVDLATHSFGQGVAVTPLQMARAIAAIANGGVLYPLSLMKGVSTGRGERILSQTAADSVRDMMYGVVEDEHGTGGKAAVRGLRIGGKTGTAQKAGEGRHGYASRSFVASFVGFVDGHSVGVPKRYVLVVMIDEPSATSIYGGTLAAPVFQKIIQRGMRLFSTEQELRGKTRPDWNDGEEVTKPAHLA